MLPPLSDTKIRQNYNAASCVSMLTEEIEGNSVLCSIDFVD